MSLKTGRMAVVLFLAALAATVALGAAAKTDGGGEVCAPVVASNTTLRVGTYNIRVAGHGADKGTPNAWGARKKDMVDLIRRLDLDVFGAQEVRRDQASYIRKQLPVFAYVGDFREKDRVHGEASPVFYRKDRLEAEKTGTFWLSKTPDVPGSKGWDAQFPRICTWVILRDKRTGKRFCFANTHPEAKGAVARRKGMALIVKRM
ncbi:MAG: hypothetical protein J6Z49_01455, partial [Kiritimatiellae bacterium]|nr:hypothetical protein [Kiritimatiellia bacterium]